MYLRIQLVFLFALVGMLPAISQVNFSAGSQWQYLTGNQAQSIPTDWMQPTFNSSGWSIGNAPFRYGDGTGGTEFSDMQNNYSTAYFLTDVTVTNLNQLASLIFSVNYDDGFILYINGQQAFSRYAPADAVFNSFATDNHESGTFEPITINTTDFNLTEGVNRIAVMALNVSLESTDFYFDLSILGNISQLETPTTLFPTFSRQGSMITQAFDLRLTSPAPAFNVIYTIDGSNPQFSPTAISAGQSVTLRIDHNNVTNRANTPGFIVRASLVQEGYGPAKPKTEIYIDQNRAITQTYPGYNWPSGDVNGQRIDLEMDSRVTTDPNYQSFMDDAFNQIPTVSVVTDMENLFDPTTGIYVNALNHGEEWERFCAVQLIDPKADSVFNVNAGLRIRGGYSRNSFFPKHAFRLFFRDEYGFSKLRYPLFEEEGVDQFDKVDLRCAQNYSWNNGSNHALYAREVFSRDAQRDLNQPYTRSRYYHLFLNGMYWGLYQTQERSEARFASDYLGGSSSEYDVVKVSTDNGYTIEATDGDLNNWEKVYNMSNTNLTQNANYFALEGKDENGTPKPNSEVFVDIDNLIDYMAIIFYGGNFDAPTSAFLGNGAPNNFYAIDNRTDKSEGFKFFCHDAEHSLLYDDIDPGDGINTDRVNIDMSINGFSGFHPQWLHKQLSNNAEYRQQFADRAYELFTGNGQLTPAQNKARLKKRTDQIEMAIIAESARWGDAGGWGLLTKDNDWLPEVYAMEDNYFPERTNVVISQLQTAKLFPTVAGPVLKVNNSNVNFTTQTISFPSTLNITHTNSGGTIYYTLNGSDPRIIGGALNSNAVELKDANMPISGSTTIKARVYKNGTWSALVYANLLESTPDYSNLRITEINYHPTDSIIGLDTINDKDFEFIEFKNIGGKAINISNMHIDSAVNYTFPVDAIVPPGGFWVVASKPKWFYNRYGLVASGNFKNNLANSGDWIRVLAPDSTPVIVFRYSDEAPWPVAADGDGYTLHARDLSSDKTPDNWQYWKPSRQIGGSPFRDESILNDIAYDDINTGDVQLYPNPTSGTVTFRFEADMPAQVQLINSQGVTIHNQVYSSGQSLDLQNITSTEGLYMFVIRIQDKLVVKKVIYQKN